MTPINSDIDDSDTPGGISPGFSNPSNSEDYQTTYNSQKYIAEPDINHSHRSSETSYTDRSVGEQTIGDINLYQTWADRVKHYKRRDFTPIQSTQPIIRDNSKNFDIEQHHSSVQNSVPLGIRDTGFVEMSAAAPQIQSSVTDYRQMSTSQPTTYQQYSNDINFRDQETYQSHMVAQNTPSIPSYQPVGLYQYHKYEGHSRNPELNTPSLQLVHMEAMPASMFPKDSFEDFSGNTPLYFTEKAISPSGMNHSHLLRHAQRLGEGPLHLAGPYGPVGPRLSEAKVAELSESIATSQEPFKYYRAGRLINVFRVNSNEEIGLIKTVKQYQELNASIYSMSSENAAPSNQTELFTTGPNSNILTPSPNIAMPSPAGHRGSIPDEENTRLKLVAQQLQARMSRKEEKRRQKIRLTQERFLFNLQKKRERQSEKESKSKKHTRDSSPI